MNGIVENADNTWTATRDVNTIAGTVTETFTAATYIECDLWLYGPSGPKTEWEGSEVARNRLRNSDKTQ